MALRTPQDVQDALDAHDLGITIQFHDQPTATSQEAADAAGCELGQIVKSLCFTINGEPLLILASGDQRVDTRKLATRYGVGRKKVRMAGYDQTIDLTGYEPGGVPPLGHAHDIPILIDATLSRYENVYGAAGASNAIFPITLENLIAITGGEVTDLAEE